MNVKNIAMACCCALLGLASTARAEDAACGLSAIDDGINQAVSQIKSSPANGHAGGHYGKAIRDLEATKKNLHEGCKAWDKEGKKGNTCEKSAHPERLVNTNPDCHLDAIEAALDGVIGAVEASPACGHAGGHYAHAVKELNATRVQLRAGCTAWAKGGEKPRK